MTASILKDPTLPDRILAEMRKHIDKIPAEGVVAGGFVADFVVGALVGRSYEVKDVDIFVANDGNDPYDELFGPSIATASEIHVAWYGSLSEETMIVEGVQKETYKIVSSQCFGKLNLITVAFEDSGSQRDLAEMVLKGFDINCVQIGVDIATKKLYYTPHFEEFLESFHLRAVAAWTPWQTVMRICKKIKHYGCSCNIPLEFHFLALAIRMVGWKANTNRDIMRCFGLARLKEYFAHREIIDQYFQLVNFSTSRSFSGRNYGECMYPGLFEFIPKFDVSPPKGMISFNCNLTSFVADYEALGRHAPGHLKKKVLTAKKESEIVELFMHVTPGYLDCPITKIRHIADFFDSRHHAIEFFSRLGLKASGQLRAIPVMERAEQKYGIGIYDDLQSSEMLPKKITDDSIAEILVFQKLVNSF